MHKVTSIGEKPVGPDQPTFIIGEIGINHNGDLSIAKKLIDTASECGFDAVKFQKRTPEKCVPDNMKDTMRETPWGYISYLDYRYKVEFSLQQYQEIDQYCRKKQIIWFASCWDVESVDFMSQFDLPCIKIPSAALTNRYLLEACRKNSASTMLSTGMSTMEQIHKAVQVVGTEKLFLAHSTSTYPCPPEELNLNMIPTLIEQFDCPIGYSGHETGLAPTVAATVLGAQFVERHITLDRAMWGSDHAASVEPVGMRRLVKDIRLVESCLGTGKKMVYETEKSAQNRLRNIDNL